jgi:hypothetical protein
MKRSLYLPVWFRIQPLYQYQVGRDGVIRILAVMPANPGIHAVLLSYFWKQCATTLRPDLRGLSKHLRRCTAWMAGQVVARASWRPPAMTWWDGWKYLAPVCLNCIGKLGYNSTSRDCYF